MLTTIVLIVSATLGLLLCRHLLSAGLRKLAVKQAVSELGLAFALRSINTVLFIVYGLVLLGLLGLDFSDIEVLLSSMFAVVGVAFFAQWSILSNITASSIIFFSFPYRVGDWVSVVEKDVDISGQVEDITLFHVLIRNLRGELITYPNNLILQKPVVRLKQKPLVGPSDDLTDELMPFAVGREIELTFGEQAITGRLVHKNMQRVLLESAGGEILVVPLVKLQGAIIRATQSAPALHSSDH
ncbi:mechanosensitive ion channel family protein [Simiduia sp. 21SJ11W-1]|uniref:mechanosensitive ion channel domain-containing protein n=1 Tax=Simiduia sp. 21SJ11W-1 TaxID=2909669 RepID=UPI0020A20D37|nr:mechanosensitive ion channel domain-containing protein [Simiduia sp. 21SJ11W-1]UTA48772.1 mechanosensitive ion channel family protein [Simiduia sp. 21SJ11W-1]